MTEPLGAIRSCLQFQVDIGIRHLITCNAVADDQKGGILIGEVQEVMAIAGACRKANARAGPDGENTLNCVVSMTYLRRQTSEAPPWPCISPQRQAFCRSLLAPADDPRAARSHENATTAVWIVIEFARV